MPIQRFRTKLNEPEEIQFKGWYGRLSSKLNLDPNPDSALQKYDYRGAFKEGFRLKKDKHFPSKFKDDDHPNRFVFEGGKILDSKKGVNVTLKQVKTQLDSLRKVQ